MNPTLSICHVSYVICHVSYIMCHVSGVICHVSYIMCRISFARCHMSCVVSGVICHMSYVIFFYHKALSNKRRENTILGKKKFENRFSICMTAQQAIHTSRVQYNINVSKLFYCRLDMYNSK